MKMASVIFTALTISMAALADAPREISVSCMVGDKHYKVSLKDCGNKIDSNNYGPYWCEGPLENSFLVKVTGNSGMSDTQTKITYIPGKFSGMSPVEINGLKVACGLSQGYYGIGFPPKSKNGLVLDINSVENATASLKAGVRRDRNWIQPCGTKCRHYN